MTEVVIAAAARPEHGGECDREQRGKEAMGLHKDRP